jgi:hypothetical protein
LLLNSIITLIVALSFDMLINIILSIIVSSKIKNALTKPFKFETWLKYLAFGGDFRAQVYVNYVNLNSI